MSGQRPAVEIHRQPAPAPPTAVYAHRAAERTRQAIALAAARRQAAQRARLREKHGGPPLDQVDVARRAWGALADEGRWGPEWFGSPTDRALVAMRTAAPEADEVLGEVALRAAIARRLQDAPCAWCLVPEVAKVTGLPEPAPEAASRRLLGRPCTECATRMRDRALDPVLASVSAVRPCTRCGGRHRWAPARALAASAAASSAPTGLIWSAGQQPPPAALRAAALTAAARRPRAVKVRRPPQTAAAKRATTAAAAAWRAQQAAQR